MKRTYAAIVLDKSGSMGYIKDQTIVGFNEQVQQLKLNSQDPDMETLVSLISFNGDVFEHIWNKPAAEVSETDASDYNPDGSTALRDAIGYTIKKLKETTDTKSPDNAYLLIIISDGQENLSRHWSQAALVEEIDSCQKSGKWTFTYMGCDKIYTEQVAKSLHIPISNAAVWDNTAVGSKMAYATSANSTARYLRGRMNNQILTSNFHSMDECLADFTEAALSESDLAPDVPETKVDDKKA